MRNIIYLFIVMFLLSCDKEDDLTPSGYERDYFDLSYLANSTDPVEQAIYSFWEETGIAVFCDDTIGSDERVDVFGNTYTYYETLSLNYSLGGVSGESEPKLLDIVEIGEGEMETVIPALDIVKEDFLPIMQAGGKTYLSLYLVDEMNAYGSGSYVFMGLNTCVLARIPALAQMTETERSELCGEVAKTVLSSIIMSDAGYADELEEFETITTSTELSTAWVHFYTDYYYTWNIPRYSSGTDMYDVGFIGEDPNMPNCCPSSVQTDVELYISEIFALETDEAFRETWGGYPRIIAKYEIIRGIVDELL